jgi:hypothetical protein
LKKVLISYCTGSFTLLQALVKAKTLTKI